MDSRIEEKLKEYVSGKRYRHSLDVRDTADDLARFWGGDRRKACIAGLLHDVARDLDVDVLKGIVRSEYDVDPCGGMARTRGLLHAYAGRVIARQEFGIDDEEILSSIAGHTTGRPGMSLLEKIIFVADYIGQGRSFRGVKTARRLAYRNLDDTVRHKLKANLIDLIRKGRPICTDTIDAYNHYMVDRVEVASWG
jgi:predicted HD superfamily hydrolase involved in NAD metabolism